MSETYDASKLLGIALAHRCRDPIDDQCLTRGIRHIAGAPTSTAAFRSRSRQAPCGLRFQSNAGCRQRNLLTVAAGEVQSSRA